MIFVGKVLLKGVVSDIGIAMEFGIGMNDDCHDIRVRSYMDRL